MSPNPTLPTTPVTPSQPLIRTFFNRTGNMVREALSSALDIPMIPPNVRNVFDESSDDEQETDMDLSESRKRSRNEDSILGDDIQNAHGSDSLIAQTSINSDENESRRRRLSSDQPPSPSNTSTPA